MFVKDFAASVASIAKEVACDGAGNIGSHKIRSSVSIYVEGDDNDDAEYELVEVEPSMLPGCGCWDGVILRVRRTVPNVLAQGREPHRGEASPGAPGSAAGESEKGTTNGRR